MAQWRGAAFHNYDSKEVLAYALEHGGDNLVGGDEALALLMNGALYTPDVVPSDAEEKKDFEWVLLDDPSYQQVCLDANVTSDGWLSYKLDVTARTSEKEATSVRVKSLKLPTFEIKGESLFRRRIVLPEELVEDGNVYHLLQYKKMPIMKDRDRTAVLAGLEHGKAVDAAAAEAEEIARADMFRLMEQEVGHEMTPEEWESYLYDLSYQDYQDKYHSDSDNDYEPEEEDLSEDEDHEGLDVEGIEGLDPGDRTATSGLYVDGRRRSGRLILRAAVVEDTLLTPPAVKDPLLTPPALKDPLLTPPAVKDPLLTPPAVKDPLLTPPAVKDPLLTPPAVKDPLLTPPALKDPLLTPPAVKDPLPTPPPDGADDTGSV